MNAQAITPQADPKADLILHAHPGGMLWVSPHLEPMFSAQQNLYKLVWVESGELRLEVDGTPLVVRPAEIVAFTPLHHLRVESSTARLCAWGFDSRFYCIHGHDSEVSCNGLLFYGASRGMVLKASDCLQSHIRQLFSLCRDEWDGHPLLREEMLRTLLKQLIIRCTREIHREWEEKKDVSSRHIETLRQFHILVDQHFRQKKTVAEYAAMLHMTPKKLAATAAACGMPTPLGIIHERILSEAQRLLRYSGKSAKEIAWALGFEEPADFSRFFRKKAGMTLTDYRKMLKGE